MAPYAVYDTNVIVSAILKPGSLPASLVALAMQGAVKLFLSREILQEYEEVLNLNSAVWDRVEGRSG